MAIFLFPSLIRLLLSFKFLIFLLYFIDYAITVVLIFLPLHSSIQHPSLPEVIPIPLFMSMGHGYNFFGYSISYTTHPHGYFVTTHLGFLIPLTLHLFPHVPLPSDNHQNTPYPWFCLCFYLLNLFFWIQLLIDMYFCHLLFIVLIFFCLNKSL